MVSLKTNTTSKVLTWVAKSGNVCLLANLFNSWRVRDNESLRPHQET